MIVLKILRGMNRRYLAGMYGGDRKNIRKIVAGKSDTMNAWTDGKSYIAINREQLLLIRESGASRLVLLMVHEYGHKESSLGDHAHDHAFYHWFHNQALSTSIGELADLLFRKYVSALCSEGIIPSSDTGYQVRFLAGKSPLLKGRCKIGERKDED